MFAAHPLRQESGALEKSFAQLDRAALRKGFLTPS
jgi:hypothetical protein